MERERRVVVGRELGVMATANSDLGGVEVRSVVEVEGLFSFVLSLWRGAVSEGKRRRKAMTSSNNVSVLQHPISACQVAARDSRVVPSARDSSANPHVTLRDITLPVILSNPPPSEQTFKAPLLHTNPTLVSPPPSLPSTTSCIHHAPPPTLRNRR